MPCIMKFGELEMSTSTQHDENLFCLIEFGKGSIELVECVVAVDLILGQVQEIEERVNTSNKFRCE